MSQIWGRYLKKYNLVWAQYQTFPLDVIHFPFISSEQYKCDSFFRTIYPFQIMSMIVCVCSHSKCQDLYHVSYPSNDKTSKKLNEVKNE